ncbi:polysaccharide biosynthesis/export family protein [Thalassotalea euphylliae]|uniref:Polysaccharide export protein n=1 Tax=Thalassotalea euphylliae TaxID=1655234 RepID=A0A3E0U6R8_9GAMM|nr:polysaccharide biosynthesis/export family protein [Thalassotalea euphylliae]REL32681.1 polysaccharide export protein [Thalassotalea euphylliae]REL37259.1 polysaccharide export protein [Thalassotalea euphylliae]
MYTAVASSFNYELGAGDKILITVYDEPDLRTEVKVNKSGLVSFPFLDDINVLGITPEALEKRITDGLKGDYLIHPQVSVSIVEYRPFFIHGEVKRPGGYAYQDDLRLDKALALAGGLSARASKSAWQITREVDGKTITITADIATIVLPDDIIKIEQSFF